MIARTARIAFHRNGPLIAAGAAAYDKHGICVACIVTWRPAGAATGYARIDPMGIDDARDLHRFIRAAAEGAFRSDPALAADYDRIETLSELEFRTPAGMAASLALHLRSWWLGWSPKRAA